MNRTWATLTASSLLLGTGMIGCTPDIGSHPATLSSSGPQAEKLAALSAARASSALAVHKPVPAVSYAETAVAAAPRDAAYRALLGQAYLQAGRFASAASALSESLSLDPSQSRAGLNLALAQAALGQRPTALATLRAVGGGAAPADLGLAMALCGDTDGAVRLLLASARMPNAGVRVRQNLAFALALGGRWLEARAVAAQDVSPQELDARMSEWMALASPHRSWDQIAAVLGVTPVGDAGEPQALALAAPSMPEPAQALAAAAPAETRIAPTPAATPVPQRVAVATPMSAPVSTPAPVLMPAAVSAPAPVERPAPVEVAVATPLPAAPVAVAHPSFVAPAAALAAADADAFVSAQPRAAPAADHVRLADRRAEPGTPLAVSYVVQLGAYTRASAPEEAWNALQGRFRLANYSPATLSFRLAGRATVLHRLSIAGFPTHVAASDLCGKIRSGSGACFVRAQAGDQLADWGKPGKGLALASR